MNYECGTMAVPAVPGAGKTFIVTNLVAKLLEENKNEKRFQKSNGAHAVSSYDCIHDRRLLRKEQ